MAIHAWDDLACRNPLVGFIDVNLRGAAQVFFQNNPLTGFIILAAVFWSGHAGGNMSVGYGALTGLVAASFTAILLNADRASLKQGLFGFNGVLVGAALPTFLAHEPLMWAYLVVGAAVSTIVTLAIANVVKSWGVPGSTAPFVFTTWLLLLAAFSLARIPITAMGPPTLPGASFSSLAHLSGGALAGILVKNVSQVYLVENAVTGVLFLVADVTGDFCTSRSERESLTRSTAGHAKQEVQGRTDRDVAASNRSGNRERKNYPASLQGS